MTSDIDQPRMPPPDNPDDVPAESDAALDRLEALIGRWEMEATFDAGYFEPGSPVFTSRGGSTEFAWLPGKFFLTQRFVTEHPAPSGIAIIGAAGDGNFTQHYYDSRGVTRVYQMSFEDRVWKLRRLHPGFCQRYAGHLSDDGAKITGAWETSADGTTWKHDFNLNYLRIA